jgi:pantothenate kinase type III
MGADARCLISGGNAAKIASALRIDARVVDNLVLEGLLKIAG